MTPDRTSMSSLYYNPDLGDQIFEHLLTSMEVIKSTLGHQMADVPDLKRVTVVSPTVNSDHS